MNQNAKLWVEALRSGKYKQGTHALCKDDRYCCLGVACELYCERVENILQTEGHDFEQKERMKANYKYYKGNSEVLPNVVRKWLGLKGEIGVFKISDSLNIPASMLSNGGCLTRLNDGGYTFAQIADIIEKEPEELFETETVTL